MNENVLLSIENLHVSFYTLRGVVRAVRGLNLQIRTGETVALVGESGCGKSVSAHAVTGLLPVPPAKIEEGKIFFDGQDVLQFNEKQMRGLRGVRVGMIFQEPMTSLNPVFKIGDQIADVFRVHHRIGKQKAFQMAVDLLDKVKIPEPERRAREYPFQLSGGMRQRAMIAMALASPKPGLIIADEPTTALDVTIQAQILHLLKELQKDIGVAVLLITHDMGVVAQVADRATVMYAGRAVEQGTVEEVFSDYRHPYTHGLLHSLPGNPEYRGAKRLIAIPGTVPDLRSLGNECPFANRCSHVKDRCWHEFPEETTLTAEHRFWCWYPTNLKAEDAHER
ncbi:MAG: ABC transporter ATP-binding protein [Spirochaetales bacterium]|nr:ABC transporter ATP-binding protein [Spirochaetales bacterium]